MVEYFPFYKSNSVFGKNMPKRFIGLFPIVFVPSKPFQPSLIFVSMTGAYPDGAPFRNFLLW